MNIRIKLMLFISFLFIIAIGNSIITFKLESYGEEKLQWVMHTHEVIITTENFIGAMKDIETGQRGYILTHDVVYLEPYYIGLVDAEKNFMALRSLTADNLEQEKLLDAIEKLMKLKLEELGKTIQLMDANNTQKVLELIKQDKGKKYMDDIRFHIDKFINTEMLLLEQRKGDFRENRSQLTTIIIVSILFFLFLAFLTFSFLNKNLFDPLKLLLGNTHKMEEGKKLDINDLTSKDEMGYLLSSFYKMNEKVHARTQKLHYKAHHDELTGLYNRTNLFDEIQNSIIASKETDSKVAILFIDLDKFKPINDTLGHDVGDAILIETAKKLRSAVRADDKIFRIGGDEFLVLIKDISEADQVEMIIVKVLKAFNQTVTIRSNELEIAISIGVAVAPDDCEDPDKLLKMADIAMYEAKKDKDKSYTRFNSNMV